MTINIADRKIGAEHRPFIIAEMSGNHNQSLDRALAIVEAAAEAGADAIKLQTYTADTMTINVGLIPFSSPFDASAVDFLEELGVSVYKIASFENTDHPLLKKVAQTGKPVIMSTGLTRLADIDESVRVLREHGCKELILLKCTSTYPGTTNLMTIPHMAQLFDDIIVGLSDHTMGIGAPVAAVALGARVIEKHFTLSRADSGVDSAFSLEPQELKSLVVEANRAFEALGKVQYGIQSVEQNSKRFKRSVYVVKDVHPGDTFNVDNLRVIRPGDGLPPKYFEGLIGKAATTEIKAGTPLDWAHF